MVHVHTIRKRKKIEERADQEKTTATEEMADQMAEMMRRLLEDRERREQELRKERQRRNEEMAKWEEETRKERQRRDEEARKDRQRRDEETRKECQRCDEESAKRGEKIHQMLRELLEGVQKQSEATRLQVDCDQDVEVAKLTSEDDIETYLTTFERLMKAHNVKKDRWTYKLTPYLTGEAQQAYVAMAQADAEDYEKVKAAILRRYDVTAESCVRAANPETSDDVCRLADNYVVAHKSEMNPEHSSSEPREEKKETSGRWNLGGKRDLKNIDCFNCHQKGHYSFNCPSKVLFCGVKRAGKWNPGVKRGGKWNPTQPCVKSGGKWNPTQPCVKSGGKWNPTQPCVKSGGKWNPTQPCVKSGGKWNPTQPCVKSGGKWNSTQTGAKSGGKWNPTQPGVKRAGAVEGNSMENILLDTGCSRSLVRQELVPREKLLEGGAIVHGDTGFYPSAQVEVAAGQSLEMTAAVSETLPMDVLLGTEVPEFGMLLGQNIVKHAEATAVTTKMRAEQEEDLQERDLRAGASVTGIAEPSLVGPEWMDTFDDELFEGGRVRARPSRSQKRAARRRHWEPTPEEVEAQHAPLEIAPHAMDITAGQLQVLQEADASLDTAMKVTRDRLYSTGVGSDGPLGQQWTAGGLELEGMLTPLNDRIGKFKYISTMDLRLTNSTCHGLSGSYIDDLVVFSEIGAQQLEHLMRLRAAKLGAKAKKCKFKAVYSGHMNQQTFQFVAG